MRKWAPLHVVSFLISVYSMWSPCPTTRRRAHEEYAFLWQRRTYYSIAGKNSKTALLNTQNLTRRNTRIRTYVCNIIPGTWYDIERSTDSDTFTSTVRTRDIYHSRYILLYRGINQVVYFMWFTSYARYSYY